MQCPRCQHENPPQAKFCLECGARVALTCTKCRSELPAGAKFCLECGEPVASRSTTEPRSPESYTPKHLAEKILTSKAALEGERKQVTVLFADLKGSMELLADRDPEEARKIVRGGLTLERLKRKESKMRLHTTHSLALAIGFVLVFGTPWLNMAQQPIRIGASMALTGKYSLQGGYGREGYQLCEKHVNREGGVLGRPIQFMIQDDASDEKRAVRVYEKLITEDHVDAVLGPYSSPITDAIADVTEKHRKLLIAPFAGTTSLWEKGRKNLIMVLSPVELLPEGFVDLAARFGLKTLAILNEDGLVAKAAAKGAGELASKKNLDLVFSETYPKGTTDFSTILNRVKVTKPDAFVIAAQLFDDLVTITRQMKEVDLDAKMLSSLPYGGMPDYHKRLEKSAEFVYSATFWEPSLRYPGNREFVSAYEKEFNRAPALQSAVGYAGCQLFAQAARRAGSLDTDKLREGLLKLRTQTILGDFAIDERGFQIAHKAVTTQWQDGKQVVLWPDEVAGGKPRFPTPPWSGR